MHSNSKKTHCNAGHLLSGSNLRVKTRNNGSRRRECITCNRQQAVARYWRDRKKGIPVPDLHTPESKKRAGRRYRRRHRASINAHRREWRKNNPEKVLTARLREKYRISLDHFKFLLEVQNNRCALCSAPLHSNLGRNGFVVDHSHQTGKVRGLLCRPCNNVLGQARDNPEVLRKAAIYVESHLD